MTKKLICSSLVVFAVLSFTVLLAYTQPEPTQAQGSEPPTPLPVITPTISSGGWTEALTYTQLLPTVIK